MNETLKTALALPKKRSCNTLALFQYGLRGESDYLPDDETRARWVVADAFREQAKKEERSMAARLRGEAGRIEAGYSPTKAVLSKIGKTRLDKIFTIFDQRCREKLK